MTEPPETTDAMLDLIDGALDYANDFNVSSDAMRWVPPDDRGDQLPDEDELDYGGHAPGDDDLNGWREMGWVTDEAVFQPLVISAQQTEYQTVGRHLVFSVNPDLLTLEPEPEEDLAVNGARLFARLARPRHLQYRGRRLPLRDWELEVTIDADGPARVPTTRRGVLRGWLDRPCCLAGLRQFPESCCWHGDAMYE